MALHKHIQSLHFPTKTWTLEEAKQWLEEHGYQEAEHAPSYVGTHSFLMPKPMSRGHPIQVFSSSMGKVFWAIVTEGAFPNPLKATRISPGLWKVGGYYVSADYKKIASRRWHQILQYAHTLDDIKAIATRTGTVKLYHGSPSEFAKALVTHGPRVPYAVEDVARHVASVYGLTWMEFRPYASRIHEVFTRLSTAPAPIAARWAWSFALGEVLTTLNTEARMLSAAKQLARHKETKLEDAHEEVHEKAIALATAQNIQYTFDAAPDILRLPDEFALKTKTGALVELVVDTRGIPEHIVQLAKRRLEIIREEEETEQVALGFWNHAYKDIKVASGSIKSMRIVIDGMERWEQDVIEGMVTEEVHPPMVVQI